MSIEALKPCGVYQTNLGAYEIFWNTLSGYIYVRPYGSVEIGFTLSEDAVSNWEQAIEFAPLPKWT